MIKKIIASFVCIYVVTFFSTAQAACAIAAPTSSPAFCDSFKAVAQCHCVSSGLPKGMCVNMHSLYDRMISMFGSLHKACEYQHDTSTQNCIDSWDCYRHGGTNSQQELCSGTGSACQ